MRRVIVSGIIAMVLALSAVTLSATSRPALSGVAAGIELCPQTICGFALFIGQFQGELNNRPANGGFVATVEHDDLPDVNQFAAITGGGFTITANHRILRGDITGGTILNVNDVQYCIKMTLEITEGGRGEVYFTGLLDHGPFPPTIAGFLTQDPTLSPCPVL